MQQILTISLECKLELILLNKIIFVADEINELIIMYCVVCRYGLYTNILATFLNSIWDIFKTNLFGGERVSATSVFSCVSWGICPKMIFLSKCGGGGSCEVSANEYS
jgi:hypothetical protein